MTEDDLRTAVRQATACLAAAGITSARPDAVALAAHLLRVDRAEAERLIVTGAPTPSGYRELVDQRARRIPLQHLTGQAAFRHLTLAVGPGVFVPRPETEVTAGLAIQHLLRPDRPAAPVVVDLGTGSGAIALAVKDEVPDARVYAVELSEQAIAWARHNVNRCGLEVDLRAGDLADAVPELVGLVNLVVSNPPYIPPGAVPVDPEVRDHDPSAALYGGGVDGLAVPAAVVTRAGELLRDGGLLVVEHGDTQASAMARLLDGGPWLDIRHHPDLTGRLRVLTAVRGAGARGHR